MKKKIFPVLSSLRGLIPLKTLVKLSGENLVLPFYHAVSDIAPPHLDALYQIKSQKEFESDLDFLLRKFKPLTLDELINLSSKPSRPSFHLSFDDGLREINDFIEPLLTRKGIPATFFVNPDFVDNRDLFFRYKASILIYFASSYSKDSWKNFHEFCRDRDLQGKNIKEICHSIGYNDKSLLDDMAAIMGVSFSSYLKEFRPYLSLEQLSSLVKKGFTIGSHSMDHPEYRFIDGKTMLHQTLQSSAWVKEKFNQPHSVFAFPFNDEGVHADFFHALGFDSKPLIDMSFGTAGLKKENIQFHKQRIPMEGYHLPGSAVIFSEYLYFLLKMPFGKNLIQR